MIQVLSRRTKNNPVLIGEPGRRQDGDRRGARAADRRRRRPRGAEGQARLGARHRRAARRLEVPRRVRGAAEGRPHRDQGRRAGEIILFIDELHTIVGAGAAEGAVDAANMLKPMLARGELRCIGATTLDEYRKHIEKDAALERRFQPVFVGEPSVSDTIAILRGLKERYEAHHGVAHPRRRARRGRGALRPLHLRPPAARQGDRPDRRVRVAAADGDRLLAARARRGRAARAPARDRARGDGEGEEGGARAGRARAGRGEGAPRRARRALVEGEGGARARRRDQAAHRRAAHGGRAGRARTGISQRVAEIRYGELPALEKELEERGERRRRADGQGGGRRGRRRRGRRALDGHPRRRGCSRARPRS